MEATNILIQPHGVCVAIHCNYPVWVFFLLFVLFFFFFSIFKGSKASSHSLELISNYCQCKQAVNPNTKGVTSQS